MQTKKLLAEIFLNQQAVNATTPGLVVLHLTISLIIAALLGLLLGQAYIRFGHSLSDRRVFSRNFLLLAVTTTLIISIVRSSLALSLGLVGALSIVRFRSAIKEPEELAFLFLTISVGLGLGAGQALLTIVAMVIILGLIAIQSMMHRTPDQPNLYVTVTTCSPEKLSSSQILEALTAAGAKACLKRLDESTEMMEAAFLVDFSSAGRLEQFHQQLRQLSPQVRISCVDDRGLGM